MESTFATKVDTTTEFSEDSTVYAKWLKTPTASDFVFTAPSILEYDGIGKVASVTSSTVSGTKTVYYVGVSPTSYAKSTTAPTDVGTYTVEINVTEDGSYGAGSVITDTGWTFAITPKSLGDSMIGAISDQTYTGSPLEPGFTVEDGSTPLNENTDYTSATYSSNTNVGQATVTISGMGNYSGTATKDFNILAADITDNTNKTQSEIYTGNAFSLSVPIQCRQLKPYNAFFGFSVTRLCDEAGRTNCR